MLSLTPVAYANPRGGAVVHGTATISESGAVMTIHQATDRAIINWQGFSNAAGETVRFQQPGATAATLNRVTGADASVINGAMTANGRVLLINPNGVIFGKTATVNTAGLVASTLQMSDEDFKAGQYRLQQDPTKPLRAVVNQGAIRTTPGGSVALVAPVVNNEGTIDAPGGKVALAAGSKAIVTMDEQGLVNLGVRESAPGNVVVGRDAVSPLLEQAVNNRHIVEAGQISTNAQGEIVLHGAEGLAINQGRISVDAVAGGSAGRARIDSTQATLLAPGAAITANGAARGGDVRLMSQRATYFTRGSSLQAKGGEGGFVEVSAPRRVTVHGDVNVSGASGNHGTFLIDPATIRITDGAGGANDLCVLDGTINAGCSPGGNLVVSEQTLEGLAATGTNIVLEATCSITLCDLTTDGVLNLTGAAGSSITLRISGGGTGGINFVDTTNQILTRGKAVTIDAGGGAATLGLITTTGGGSTGGAAVTITAAGNVSLSAVDGGTSAVSVTSTAGSILDGNDGGTPGTANITGGAVTLSAGLGIGSNTSCANAQTGELEISGTSLDALSGTLANDQSAGIFLAHTGTGTINVSQVFADGNGGGAETADAIVFRAAGSVADGNGACANFRGSDLTLIGSGTAAFGAVGALVNTNVANLSATTNGGGIFLAESSGLTTASLAAGGTGANVQLTAAGAIGALTATAACDAVAVTTTAGGINVGLVTAGTVTLNAATTITDGNDCVTPNTNNITAATVSLNAACGGIGAAGNGNVEVTSNTLTARSGTTAGDQSAAIFLRELSADGTAVDIQADANGTIDNVTLISAGSLLEQASNATVDIRGATVSLSLGASGSIGTTGGTNHLDIDAASIVVNNVGGGATGIFINDIAAICGDQTLAAVSFTYRSGTGTDVDVKRDNTSTLASLTTGSLVGCASGVNVTLARANGSIQLGNFTAQTASITAQTITQAASTAVVANSVALTSVVGAVTATTQTSSLQVAAATSVNVANSGAALSVTGATATNGSITIANTGFGLTSTGAVTANAAGQTVTLITAGSGDITLGALVTSPNVSLQSAGAILDGNEATAGTNDIAASTQVSFSAGTNIGISTGTATIGAIDFNAPVIAATSGINAGDDAAAIFLNSVSTTVDVRVNGIVSDTGGTADAVFLSSGRGILDNDGANGIVAGALTLRAAQAVGHAGCTAFSPIVATSADVQTTAGAVRLDFASSLTALTVVAGGAGDVCITSTGAIGQADITATGDDVTVSIAGNLGLGAISAGTVSLTSTGGALTDANDGGTAGTSNITAAAVTLAAATAIGTCTSACNALTGEIEIAAGACGLIATSGTLAGDQAASVFVAQSTGDLRLRQLSVDANGGTRNDSARIRSAGAIVHTSGDAGSSGMQALDLVAQNSIGAGQALQVEADLVNATSATGEVNLTDPTGGAAFGTVSAGSSAILVSNGGDLTVGQVTAGTLVLLSANGSIVDGNDLNACCDANPVGDVILDNVIAPTVSLSARNAIGSCTVIANVRLGEIEVNTGSVDANSGFLAGDDSAPIFIAGTGASLALGAIESDNDGSGGVRDAVRVRSAGSVTDGNDGTTAGTSNIVGGSITVLANNGIGTDTGNTVGELEVTGTVIRAQSGLGAGNQCAPIFLNSLANFAVDVVEADINGTVDAVRLRSAGNLTDFDATAGTNVVRGSSVTLLAGGSIGAVGTAFANVVASSVTAQTAGGDVVLSGSGALSTLSVVAGGSGDALVTWANAITRADITATGDDIALTVNGSIGLGAINAGAGNVNVTSTNNALTDANDCTAGTNNITGNAVTLLAGLGIGSGGVAGEIEVAAGTLAATSGTNAGDQTANIFLSNTDASVSILTIAADTDGGATPDAVNLRATGTILDGQGADDGAPVNNIAASAVNFLGATGIGAACSSIETTAGTYSVTAAGSAFLANSGALTSLTATITGGSLTVSTTGNLTLATVTTGAGAGAVTLTSVNGAILDGNDGTPGTNNITTGALTLAAGLNIGTDTTCANAQTGELEFNATSVAASSGTLTGNDTAPIFLSSRGSSIAVNLIAADADGTRDNVSLRSISAITDANGACLNFDGAALRIVSSNAVGAGNAVETSVTTLLATLASGAFEIQEASGLCVVSLTTCTSSSMRLSVGGGTLTQTGAIAGGSLLVQGCATANTLTNAGNSITNLAAAVNGTFDYFDTNNLATATVLSVSGITNTAGTAAGRATSIQTGGTLTLNQAIDLGSGVCSGGTLALNVGSTVSVAAAGNVIANRLELRGNPNCGGLTATGNQINQLFACTTSGFSLFDSSNLTIKGITASNGTVILSGPAGGRTVFVDCAVNLGTGSLVVVSLAGVAGAMTQDAQGLITAGGLRLVSLENGSVVLDQANAIGRVQGQVNGGLTLNSTVALAVDTVVGQSNLTTTNDPVSLTAPCVAVNQSISSGSATVSLIATTGSITGGGLITVRDLSLRAVCGTVGTAGQAINHSQNSGGTLTITDGSCGAGADCAFVTAVCTLRLGRVIANNEVRLTSTNGSLLDVNDSNGGTSGIVGDDTIGANVCAAVVQLRAAANMGSCTIADNQRLGEIEINTPSVALLQAGAVLFVGNASNCATTLASLVATSTGTVRYTQRGTGALTVTALTTSNHVVSLATTAGTLTVTCAAVSNNRNVTLTSGGVGDLELGRVTLGTGSFTATAGGAILDVNDINGCNDANPANDTIVDNVVAGSVSLTANRNIGTDTTATSALLGEIELATGTLGATSGNAAGDQCAPIHVAGTAGTLSLDTVIADSNGGTLDDIRIRASGSILDGNDGATAGTANLLGAGVTLIAGCAIGAAGTAGEVEVRATGLFTATSGTAAGDQSAPIHINGLANAFTGDLSLGLISADADGTVDDVVLGAVNLLDGNGAANNVRAATATLVAQQAIGAAAGGELQTDVTALTATAGTAGDGGIFIREASCLAVNAVNAFGDATGTAGNVSLVAVGAITDGNGGTLNVTGDALTLQAATGIGAGDALEIAVVSLTASTTAGDVELAESCALSVTGITTPGRLRLNIGGGALTQTGAIAANALLVSGATTGATLLNASNNVATIAASLTGSLAYGDVNALTVDTVFGVDGITLSGATSADRTLALRAGGALALTRGVNVGTSTTTGGTVALQAGGTLSQDATNGAILANGLDLRGTVTGANLVAANAFNRLSGTFTGTLGIVDTVDLTIGSNTTVLGTSTGIVASGNPNVSINNTGGTVFLDERIDVGTGNVVLVSASSAAASIDQDAQGIITAQGLRIVTSTEGGGVVLDEANQVDRIQGLYRGALTFTSARALAVDTVVSANDVVTTGDAVTLSAPSIALTRSIDTTNGGAASANDVTLSATGGAISGTALVNARDLALTATTNIGAAGNAIQYRQTNGGCLTVNSAVSAFINGTTGLALGQVTASSSVALTATGAITDANDSNGGTAGVPGDDTIVANVTAPALSLIATTGIGTDTTADNARLGQIELAGTTVSNLQVTSGNVLVNNTNAAATTLASLTAGGSGTVVFEQLGGGSLTVAALSTNDHDVSLSVGGTADLAIGTFNLGTRAFIASAGGRLIDGNDSNNGTAGSAGDDTIAVNVTAGSVALSAGSSIGTDTAGDNELLGEIEVDTAGLVTASSGVTAGEQAGAGIFLAGTGASLTLGTVAADANGTTFDTVRVRSAGAIVDGNDAGTPVLNLRAGDLVLRAGTNIGADTGTATDGELELVATSVNAISGAAAGDQAGAGIFLASTGASVISLNQIEADNDAVANRDEVRFRAAGRVTDGNGATRNLAGTTVTVIAGLDVGTGGAGALETSATALNATAGGTLQLANTGNLTAATLIATGAGADVNLTQCGTIGSLDVTATDDDITVSAGAIVLGLVTTGTTSGSVSLTATTGAITDGNDGTAGTVNVVSRDVTLSTQVGAVGADTSACDARTGELEITASNALRITAGSTAGDQCAPVFVAAAGDLRVNGISADANGTPDAVRLRAGGAIVDAQACGTDLAAGAATLIAATGIGAADALETRVGTLAATSTAGAIAVVEACGLTVASISTPGDVSLTLTAGDLSQTGTIGAANLHVAGPGVMNLGTQANAIASLTAGLTGTTGSLAVRDADGFSIGAAGVLADGASVTLAVDAGIIAIANAIDLDGGDLTLGGATTQTAGVVTADAVQLGTAGVAYDLGAQANSIGSVSGAGTVVRVRDDAGLCVGTLTATTSLRVQSSGTVVQTGVVTTPLLTVAGGGDFDFGTQANAIGTVATCGTVNALAARDDVDLVAGALAVSSTVAFTTDALTQSGALTGCAAVTLTSATAGGGDFDLGGQDNAIGAVATGNAANTVSVRSDGGFVVGTLTADTSVAFTTDGAITQTGVLTAPDLTLASTTCGAGDVSLHTRDNALGTVSSTGTLNSVRLRETDGLVLGVLSVDTTVLLDAPCVTQTGALTGGAAVTLTGGAGADFALTHACNAFASVAGVGALDQVSLRDDGGFDLGSLGAASLTLASDGGVGQSAAIGATALTVTGSGAFDLDGQNNAFGSVATCGTVGTVNLRDDCGFTVAGLSAGAIVLASQGTVDQTGAIAAPQLALVSGGGAVFALSSFDNTLGTVSGCGALGSVSLRDDGGIALGALVVSGTLALVTSGTVTQCGALTGGAAVTLTATGAGSGDFVLSGQANQIASVATGGTVNTVSVRGDGGFAVAGIAADTSVTLVSDGTVTQSGALVAPDLTLGGATGAFALAAVDNDVDTLATSGAVASVQFRDADGFSLGDVTAGAVDLASDGIVSQGCGTALAATCLTLRSSQPGNGCFLLDTGDNALGTVSTAGVVGGLALRSDGGMEIAGIGAATVRLQSDGAVTQTGAIQASFLTVASTTSGEGEFLLDVVANSIGTVIATCTVDTLAVRDDAGFRLGCVSVDGALTLHSDGTVDQCGALTGGAAVTLTASTAGCGTFLLTDAFNGIASVRSTSAVAQVSVRDDGGFAVGALEAGAVTLASDGGVTQTGALTAASLTLARGGAFALASQANAVCAVRTCGTVGSVALRSVGGFDVGTFAVATAATFVADGTLTQSGAIAAPLLTLTAGTSGALCVAFGSEANALGTVTSTNALDQLAVRSDASLDLGALDVSALSVTTDLLTQSGALTGGAGVTLTSATCGGGDFDLGGQDNDIGAVATGNTANTVSVRSDGGFVVGTLTADTSVDLQSSGAVTQTGAVTTPSLTVSGTTGTFTLVAVDSDVDAFATAGAVASVALRDADGFSLADVRATSVLLCSDATVDQACGTALTATCLTLRGGGTFDLSAAGNALGTVSTCGTVDAAIVRDDAGLAFGAFGAQDLTVVSDGAVSQSGALTVTNLILRAATAGEGDFDFGLQANDLTSVVVCGVVNSVALRDDAGITLGATAADARITLSTNGAVTQCGALTTGALVLASAGGTGDFSLDGAGNDWATVETCGAVDQVNLRDDDGFAFGAFTAGAVRVQTGGDLSQTAAIAVSSLALTAAAPAAVALDSQNNAFGTVRTANVFGSVALRDDAGFTVGDLDAAGTVTLRSDGAVAQACGTAIGAATLALSGAGTFALSGDVDTIDGTAGGVTFTDADDLVVAGLDTGATGVVTLDAGGTITGTGLVALTANLNATGVGSAADLFDVELGGTTLNATVGTGGLFVFDPTGLNVNVTSLGAVQLVAGGDLSGRVDATSISLDAGGAVGTRATPFAVNAVSVFVDADGAIGGVAAALSGTVTGGDRLPQMSGDLDVPGGSIAMFNGVQFFPLVPVIAPVPDAVTGPSDVDLALAGFTGVRGVSTATTALLNIGTVEIRVDDFSSLGGLIDVRGLRWVGTRIEEHDEEIWISNEEEGD